MFGFNPDGTPRVPTFQNTSNNNQGGQATPDSNQILQAVLAQNQQLQQQMQVMMQKLQGQQQTPQGPQAPKRPTDFNPNEMFDPDTESGKWYNAQREYENTMMLNQVGEVVQKTLGGYQQEQQQQQLMQRFFQEKQVPPEQQAAFQQFLDQPAADIDTLYQIFQHRTAGPPQQNTQQQQAIQRQTPEQGKQQEPQVPPSINTVNSPSQNQPQRVGLADAAKAVGYIPPE